MAALGRYAWLDALVAACVAGGLAASALFAMQLRGSTYAASDFKTLYASVWCFAHRIDAYSIANLQHVFAANGVIQPEQWYGHAPVYPWTTLALLLPLAAVGMVPATYVLTVGSCVLMAAALTALMRYAANSFGLGLGWRIAVAVLCGCAPLLAFGLAMGNVSVAVCALCFLAFLLRERSVAWCRAWSLWLPGAALAIAFLLKPHIAFWVGAGLLVLPERAARATAARALVLIVGFSALTAATMAALGTLGMETHSYLAMLAAETSGRASMSAASREVLPVVSQITSLDSIVGFWVANPAVRVALTGAALLGLGILVVGQTRRVATERGALLAIGAWSALGMLATYHRAIDAALLLLLTPWVVDRVRRMPREWHVWATLALYCAMSASASFPVVFRWVASLPQHSLTAFVLMRQVGLADFLLLVVLLMAMAHERRRDRALLEQDAEEDELSEAAA